METLSRRRAVWRMIWGCAVCMCPTKRTLGLYGLNRFKPSSKIFYWLFQGGTSFVDFLCFCSVLCLLCLFARLFICALWSPAGKGLTSWLSFVVSNCEFVTFPLVSWVGCGTWLYRLLILAPLLTLRERPLFFRGGAGGGGGKITL